MPTELVWDGKYKDGKKSSPLRINLPFQDVETVNESAQERQRMLDLFSSRRPADFSFNTRIPNPDTSFTNMHPIL